MQTAQLFQKLGLHAGSSDASDNNTFAYDMQTETEHMVRPRNNFL